MQGVGFLSLISQALATDLYRDHFNSGFSHLSRSCKIRTHPIHCILGSRREGEGCALHGGLLQVACGNATKQRRIKTVLRTSYAGCMYFQACLPQTAFSWHLRAEWPFTDAER